MAIRIDYVDGVALDAIDLNNAFADIKNATSGDKLHQFNETPAFDGTAGSFKTAFPYVPGTLQVYLGRERQIKDVDHQETTFPSATQPTRFTFLQGVGLAATDPNPTSDAEKIRVDYMRADL